jgi:hypothetical protein
MIANFLLSKDCRFYPVRKGVVPFFTGKWYQFIPSLKGWTPDNAFQNVYHIPEDKIDSRLIELNKKEGVTQYWYAGTGEIIYSGSPVIYNDSLITKISKLCQKLIGKH